MTLDKEVVLYVDYFRKQLPEIATLPNPLFRKTLYVTLLDCLSRAAFANITSPRDRFVTFIDTCSRWPDNKRVSAPQLIFQLDRLGFTGTILYSEVSTRVARWFEGSMPRPDNDPEIDHLRTIMTSSETQCVEKTRYSELLYTYRNHLIHEFREPGYGMEFSSDPNTPYYHSRMQQNSSASSWELVFPLAFFHDLSERSVIGIEEHLIKNRINPYEAYKFGTFWQR